LDSINKKIRNILKSKLMNEGAWGKGRFSINCERTQASDKYGGLKN
jgi:hypothetical protein